VQQVLGHASLETTQGYLHAEAGRVTSPLDSLPGCPSNPSPPPFDSTSSAVPCQEIRQARPAQ
jgi:hypothetical protein